MTRKLILMLCITAMALGMTAQQNVEKRINVIRQAYANRMNLMQNQPYDDDSDKVDRLTIVYSRMYPGTGMARFKDTYYWTDDENEEYMLKPTLYFMTRQYTMNSGIYKFYNEYLFDAETGEPMFMLVTTEFAVKREYRFYFDKGKLIRQTPAKIEPVKDGELEHGIEVDKNGKAVAASLLKEMEAIKSSFHDHIPTYPW